MSDNLSYYKPKVSLIETIECPKVGFFYTLAFKLCKRLAANHRRMIVLTSLAARLNGKHKCTPAFCLGLVRELNMHCSPSAVKFPMALARRIWPHVIDISKLADTHDDRLVKRLVSRLPMWFMYGDLDQRIRDVNTVLKYCRTAA